MANKTLISKEKTITLQILETLFRIEKMTHIRIRLWGGSLWPSDAEATTKLVLNHPGALRSMFLSSSVLGMAEAYLYNHIDIEGYVEVYPQV